MAKGFARRFNSLKWFGFVTLRGAGSNAFVDAAASHAARHGPGESHTAIHAMTTKHGGPAAAIHGLT